MPANNTAATAIDIGTLTGYVAYTNMQDAWNGAGVDDLWYSYLPVAGDDVLEVYAYGNGTTVLTSQTIRTGPPPAATELDNSHSSTSRPVQQDIVTFVTPGEAVYIKIIASNVNPAVVHVRIARGQKEPIIHGDLFINDSSQYYPGVVMARATAIPSRYSLNYPAGEGHQTLRNGVIAVLDAFNAVTGPRLYDVASDGFTARATQPTMPDGFYTKGLSTNQIDTFWAFKTNPSSFAVSFDADGVVGTPLDLGTSGIETGAPQADNSALYCIEGTDITKVTNPGGARSTLLSVDATFTFMNNVLMLTDDTLLVGYEKAATVNYVKQFDLTGTLLSTTTLTTVTGTVVEWLFYDPQDPLYFWSWRQTSVLNIFERWLVGANAAPVEAVQRNKFVESVSQTTVLAADTVYSGADFSCVPIVLRLSTPRETTHTIRRLRRGLLPQSAMNRRMKIPTLELLLRTGIGLLPEAWDHANVPQGANPHVMLRISKDGGKTWLPERWISAGERGQFKDRVRWQQATGNYRNGVFEIVVSDPVDWQMLALLGEPEEGPS